MALKSYWHSHEHSFPVGKILLASVVFYACMKAIDLLASEAMVWMLTR